MIQSLILLFIANVFMTIAWYGHLKNMMGKPLYFVILVSWGIALIEYCFQVPANRIGSQYFSIAQLKVSQEIITMIVFALFSIFYLKVPVTKNYLIASTLMIFAAYFIFKDGRPS